MNKDFKCGFAVPLTGGVTKLWLLNTDFDNPNNWDPQRLPCKTDRAIFPAQLQSAVSLVVDSTKVGELVLPSNGELILPLTGTLQITGNRKSTSDCPVEDIVFTRTWDEAWLNPNNWLTMGHDARQSVPHLERIPCTHDLAEFPTGSSFRVRLPEVPVTVGSVSILGQTQLVEIVGTDCEERTGCRCAGHADLQDAVCKYTRQPHGDCYQNTPACVAPVTPLGHCCPICGAYLLFELKKPEQGLDRLRELLDSFLKKSQYSKVSGYISRPAAVEGTSARTIQVILSDVESYRGDCNDLANEFAEKIRNNDYFGVRALMVHAAGELLAPSTLASVLGVVLGTLLAAILALGVIYFVFIGYHQTGWRFPEQAFVFARFENAPSEGEEAVETRVEVLSREPQQPKPPSTSMPQSLSASAFDNPMFGKTKVEQSKALPTARVTHENPVYSELSRREEQEKDEPPLTTVDLEDTDAIQF
ncbi:hypothetical protein C0J52_03412 [Blattella germanica]|nr:hypothetical protein C0J52_03412 [Blattella germanica]